MSLVYRKNVNVTKNLTVLGTSTSKNLVATTSANLKNATITSAVVDECNGTFTSMTVTNATVDTLSVANLEFSSINDTVIGDITPSSGKFTTLSANSIENTPIGTITPSTGSFTTLSATSLENTPIGTVTPSSAIFTDLTINGSLICTNLNNTVIGNITPAAGTFTTLQATTGLNNTIIGSITPSTGSFTTLSATSLENTPIGTITPSSATFTDLTVTGTLICTNIDNTVIGNITPASGTFTTLEATSGLDNTVIGSVTPADGTFTTLIASSLSITGGLNNIVIGNVTAADGNFTTLTATTLNATQLSGNLNVNNFELQNVSITSGTINGVTIGNTSPTTGNFTSVTSEQMIVTSNTIQTIPRVQIQQLGSGDASLSFSVLSDTVTMGIDNDDSKNFVISYHTALGTNNCLTINSSGVLTIPNINITGGNINGVTIGGTTPADATFTTLNVTTLNATTLSSALNMNSQPLSNVNITSGSIDNVIIGATTPSTGNFQDLTVTGTLTATSLQIDTLAGTLNANGNSMTNVNIDSGSIDNVIIGNITPAAGSFTNIDADQLNVTVNNALTDPICVLEQKGVGDAALQYITPGPTYYTMGIDQDDSDTFKISTASVLNSTPALSINTLGVVTIPNVNITAGTINDVSIGATTSSTGAFTTVTTDNLSATTLNNALNANTQNITLINIDSGTIDNVTIGGTTPADGSFVNLSATGTVQTTNLNATTLSGALNANDQSITNINIDSGTIDGVTITGSTGTFNTLTCSTLTARANDTSTTPFVVVEQGGTGDAALEFLLTAGQSFVMGIDNSDSDVFTISRGSVLGTNNCLTIDNTGAVTIPNVDITGGSIDNVVIGAITPSTGTFTTANITSLHASTLGGPLDANNQIITSINIDSGSIDGVTIGSAAPITSAQFTTATITTLNATTLGANLNVNNKVLSNVNITSGSINGTVIGDVTPAAGTFTTVNADTLNAGTLTATTLGSPLDCNSQIMTQVNIDSGSIDGVTIGDTTPASATFTSLLVNGQDMLTSNSSYVPDIQLNSVSLSTSTATGSYFKLGKMVWFTCYIVWSLGAATGSVLTVTLPFTISSTVGEWDEVSIIIGQSEGLKGNSTVPNDLYQHMEAYGTIGTDYFTLKLKNMRSSGTGAGLLTDITHTEMSASGTLSCSGMFYATV